jgi:hypothetical protein
MSARNAPIHTPGAEMEKTAKAGKTIRVNKREGQT